MTTVFSGATTPKLATPADGDGDFLTVRPLSVEGGREDGRHVVEVAAESADGDFIAVYVSPGVIPDLVDMLTLAATMAELMNVEDGNPSVVESLVTV